MSAQFPLLQDAYEYIVCREPNSQYNNCCSCYGRLECLKETVKAIALTALLPLTVGYFIINQATVEGVGAWKNCAFAVLDSFLAIALSPLIGVICIIKGLAGTILTPAVVFKPQYNAVFV